MWYFSGKINSYGQTSLSDFTEEITTVADSGAETIFTDLEIMLTLLSVRLSEYLYGRL